MRRKKQNSMKKTKADRKRDQGEHNIVTIIHKFRVTIIHKFRQYFKFESVIYAEDRKDGNPSVSFAKSLESVIYAEDRKDGNPSVSFAKSDGS
jgi:hypothetical protein